ncbi:protein of unknown function [Magnetospirillum gryphiswaldense MSR-1 v2]|uniref:Uncharacterized protein n=1 Tax=Magnetospirillum gryphiswaldense (strain DSM 6361 / JCM 21280 / NBRC 15271 / MSR-1) TaxID=431944 RepID=V6F511_MAGGM|nr:protein of unknown function [Magnetospirillum gryphiswaldense MSR-1 v2]
MNCNLMVVKNYAYSCTNLRELYHDVSIAVAYAEISPITTPLVLSIHRHPSPRQQGCHSPWFYNCRF